MAKVLERSLYETDYYAWTRQQAAELRALAAARVNSTLDLANLAEEVESLGRSDLATVRSQLRRIIEHLLKLEYSPTAEPRFGWRESVIEARDVIADVSTATLAREAEGGLKTTYQQSRRKADVALRRHGEHDAAAAMPADCPYSFQQIVGSGTRRTGTGWSTIDHRRLRRRPAYRRW
jgi:hypothetical protein